MRAVHAGSERDEEEEDAGQICESSERTPVRFVRAVHAGSEREEEEEDAGQICESSERTPVRFVRAVPGLREP